MLVWMWGSGNELKGTNTNTGRKQPCLRWHSCACVPPARTIFSGKYMYAYTYIFVCARTIFSRECMYAYAHIWVYANKIFSGKYVRIFEFMHAQYSQVNTWIQIIISWSLWSLYYSCIHKIYHNKYDHRLIEKELDVAASVPPLQCAQWMCTYVAHIYSVNVYICDLYIPSVCVCVCMHTLVVKEMVTLRPPASRIDVAMIAPNFAITSSCLSLITFSTACVCVWVCVCVCVCLQWMMHVYMCVSEFRHDIFVLVLDDFLDYVRVCVCVCVYSGKWCMRTCVYQNFAMKFSLLTLLISRTVCAYGCLSVFVLGPLWCSNVLNLKVACACVLHNICTHTCINTCIHGSVLTDAPDNVNPDVAEPCINTCTHTDI